MLYRVRSGLDHHAQLLTGRKSDSAKAAIRKKYQLQSPNYRNRNGWNELLDSTVSAITGIDLSLVAPGNLFAQYAFGHVFVFGFRYSDFQCLKPPCKTSHGQSVARHHFSSRMSTLAR